MKNILAENMRRFGVKNLSESDVKRIEEASLNEAFKDTNQFTWPHFNNQQQVDSFRELALNAPTGNPAVWKAIFAENPNMKIDQPYILTKLGAASQTGFASVFWYSQALNPNLQFFFIPTSMEKASKIMRQSYTTLANWNAKFNGKSLPVNTVMDKASAQAKWWDTMIEFPVGSGKRTQTRWQLFSATYLAPTLPKIAPLFVKATATPAAGQMQPGTQPKQ